MAKKVLVGGGTGFIGQRLGELLKSQRYDVYNISRMPGASNISWTSIQVNGLPSNTHAIVNCAGQQFMDFTKMWTPGFKQNVVNSRVCTTRSLANAINQTKTKPEVFIVIAGVGYYPPSEEKQYDENSNCCGDDFFSKLCIELEAAAKEVKPPVRLVIIRSGAVVGRWGGLIKNTFLPFFFGLGGRLASGKQYLPWIHIDDLTRLILFSIENKNVTGILNGVAPQIITNAEFTKAFAAALNRPAILPVPEVILNKLLNEERAMLLTKGQHVTPQRVLEYRFKYNFPTIEAACQDVAHLFPKEKKMCEGE